MPITLPVEVKADPKSVDRTADRLEQRLEKAGTDAGRAFAKSLENASSKADPKTVDRFAKTYDKVADAAGRLRSEEAKLADLRNRGASNTRIISQAEAVQRARRAEARATRDAVSAYKDMQRSAEDATRSAFGKASGAAMQSGRETAEGFLDGFAGASALTRLASATGPIGLALTAAVALGAVTGRKLVEQIELGMASLQMKDTFAARMGVDDATMERLGTAAGKAYANSIGTSIEENLRVVQNAVQGGLIDADASEADIQKIIEQIQTVSKVLEEDSQSIARGVRNFIRTGMVDSTEEALDLVVAATQKGLNISGDLLDTFEEYGTKFRDVGLSGEDALGLINQMLEGGIRNTDVAADALKEFAISAVDGSDSTSEAFAALGFDAQEMASKFAQGGEVARAAFSEVLTALNSISDPLAQETVGTQLFKTKWEDAGDAIKNADLQTAGSELGTIAGATDEATEKLDRHTSSWNELGREVDLTFGKMREWLADTTIGKFLSQGVPDFLSDLLTGINSGPPGAIPGAVQGVPVDPSALPGTLLAPPTANTPNSLESLFGPSDVPAPGQSPADTPTPSTRTTPAPITPGSGGSRSGAMTLPYPAEYGQPARPGETDQQYQARMADILAQHRLAEARARVATSETDDLVAANNAVVDAQMQADQARSRYQQSLIEQQGKIVIPLPEDFASGPRPGQSPEEYSAESSLLEAQQKKAEALAEERRLMASGTATAQELTAAHNEVIEAQRDENEASMRLSQTYARTSQQSEKMSQALGEIGAQLDSDLGISNGLAGVADNITRFLASLAFAPVVGALRGVQASTGIDSSTAGSGIAGMAAAAAGFGKPTSATMTPMTPIAIGSLTDALGANSQIAAIGQIASGMGLQMTSGKRNEPSSWHHTGQAGDFSNSYGPTEEMHAFATYLATNFGSVIEELIYSDPQRGDVTIGGPYDSSTLAQHRDHVHVAIKDQYAQTVEQALRTGVMAAAPSMGSSASLGAGLPIPLPVVIVGGAAGASGAGATSGAAAAAGAAVGPASMAGTSKASIASYIAQKALAAGYSPSDAQAFVAQAIGESNLDPAAFGATTGDASGGAAGIFQFTPQTWAEYGKGGDPFNAQQNIDAYFRLAHARDPRRGDMRSRLGAISVGGPAVPANNAPWDQYMAQAGGLIGTGSTTPRGGTGTGALGVGGLPQSAPTASTVSGIAPAGGRGEGGLGLAGGLGGMLMSGLSAAAGAGGMAANAMAPGAGAAIAAGADIAIKLANRTAQLAGEVAGIGVGGLMETFLPVESSLADPMNSWFGRIVGGMIGAVPQLPNMAGGQAAAPNGAQPAEGQGGAPGNQIDVTYNNYQATEDRAGADLTNHLMAMNAGPGQLV